MRPSLELHTNTQTVLRLKLLSANQVGALTNALGAEEARVKIKRLHQHYDSALSRKVLAAGNCLSVDRVQEVQNLLAAGPLSGEAVDDTEYLTQVL